MDEEEEVEEQEGDEPKVQGTHKEGKDFFTSPKIFLSLLL